VGGDQLKVGLSTAEPLEWQPTLLAAAILLLLFAVVASTLELLPTSLLGHGIPESSVSEWYSFVLVTAVALCVLTLYQASRATGSSRAGDPEYVFRRTDHLRLYRPPAVFWWVLLLALVSILVVPILWRIGWLPALHYPMFGPPRL
jgi:hypothetical protein